MTSTDPSTRGALAESVETMSRSNRRQASDRSDVSIPPSHESDCSSNSMAIDVSVATGPTSREMGSAKSNGQHVEDICHRPVQAMNETNAEATVGMNGTELPAKSTSHTEDDTASMKPRRRFAPEPIETSTRSSKQEKDSDIATSPQTKRKFTPEPIETTVKTSRASDSKQDEDKVPKPRRKFAVEPVETTVTSSRDKSKKLDGLTNSTRPKKRFAVEPIETSTKSSKDKEIDTKTTKPRRKFAVEPVETSIVSSQKRKEEMDDEMLRETPSRSSSGGRKFSPELLGTAKASYRKKQGVQSAVPKWLRDEAAEGSWSAPELPESKFSAANLAKKARADPRRHSYTVPDLPMITSDDSDEEASLGSPGTILLTNSHNQNPPRLTKQQHQDIHAQHLADMKTLRAQAVAAYGDQEDHVPFGHYGGDSDDEDRSMSIGKLSIHGDADPQLFRRMSHSDLHLIQEDMRRHQLEQAKHELHEDTAGISRFSAAALAARHHLDIHHPAGYHYKPRHEPEKPEKPRNEEDKEYAEMRKAAAPPMEGNDIKFPFSVSPKMTRCDPDQMPRPRRANSEDEEERDIGTEGMWSARISPVTSRKEEPLGLWGGLCQKDESRPTRPSTPLRSGLQTPAVERGDPFGAKTPSHTGTKTPRRMAPGSLWGGGPATLPLTPPRSRNEKPNDDFAAALDQKLSLERQIDEEFSPHVITQIYNYLSLGYPPLARPFDDELSKISRISLVELRRGDRSATGTMKGHVGVPEGEGDGEEDDDGRVKGCRRWDALRLYVREWARQSPLFQNELNLMNMRNGNIGTGMWGNNAPVRKGSWGF